MNKESYRSILAETLHFIGYMSSLHCLSVALSKSFRPRLWPIVNVHNEYTKQDYTDHSKIPSRTVQLQQEQTSTNLEGLLKLISVHSDCSLPSSTMLKAIRLTACLFIEWWWFPLNSIFIEHASPLQWSIKYPQSRHLCAYGCSPLF